MPVGDLLEVRYISSAGAQVGQNIRHYRIDTITGTELTRPQLADGLSVRVRSLYKALLSSSAEFRGVAVKRVFPLPVTAESLTEVDRGPGTRTGDPLPTQVSGLISLRTGLAGRRNRGRLYTPFPAETDSDSSAHPGTTYATNLAALAVEFFGTVIVTFGVNITVLQNVIHKRGTSLFVNIIEARPTTNWATQRRRGTLGRPNPTI